MTALRLGDEIDDFCVRCHRITNHFIVSMLENKPAKVRCRSCHSDHNFLEGQQPPSRRELLKEKLAREAASESGAETAPPDPPAKSRRGRSK